MPNGEDYERLDLCSNAGRKHMDLLASIQVHGQEIKDAESRLRQPIEAFVNKVRAVERKSLRTKTKELLVSSPRKERGDVLLD